MWSRGSGRDILGKPVLPKQLCRGFLLPAMSTSGTMQPVKTDGRTADLLSSLQPVVGECWQRFEDIGSAIGRAVEQSAFSRASQPAPHRCYMFAMEAVPFIPFLLKCRSERMA